MVSNHVVVGEKYRIYFQKYLNIYTAYVHKRFRGSMSQDNLWCLLSHISFEVFS